MNLFGELLRKTMEGLIALVSKGSYSAIILTMAGESALLPIPSEIVMPLAGFLVSAGEMNFFLATGSGVLGNLLGSVVSYYLGIRYGREMLDKYGRYFLLRKDHIKKSEFLFQKWGRQAVLLGRMLPGIRTIISFPAGIFEVPLKDLILYTVLGSIPWNAALVAAGFLLRENWRIISAYSHHLLVLSATMAAMYVFFKLKKSGKSNNLTHPKDASGKHEG